MFFFPYKSFCFECYATMSMLADAYISSLGHLWSDQLISSCSVPTFGLLFSTTDSFFLTFTSLNPFTQVARTKSIRLWISIRSWVELHYTDYILHIFNYVYCYRYEIDSARIVRSQFIDSAQQRKTGRILGTWHQCLLGVSGLCYSKQIEFQEEFMNFLTTWLL